jgi:hypothetical protein
MVVGNAGSETVNSLPAAMSQKRQISSWPLPAVDRTCAVPFVGGPGRRRIRAKAHAMRPVHPWHFGMGVWFAPLIAGSALPPALLRA